MLSKQPMVLDYPCFCALFIARGLETLPSHLLAIVPVADPGKSSTDTVCLRSEPKTVYESDILDSTDTACRPCESGPAYASNLSSTTDIPVETESACGSDFRFPAEISFDSGSAKGPDIPYSTEISLTRHESYNSESFSGRSQIRDQSTCSQFATSINGNPTGPFQSHSDDAQATWKQSHVSGVGDHGDHNGSISAWGHQPTCDKVMVSEYIPCGARSRPSSSFSMQHHSCSRLMAKTNGSDPASTSIQITNQPTCSQVAASSDGTPFESCIDDHGQSSPSCSCSMRHHDCFRLMANNNSSDPSSCSRQITIQHTCGQVAASINNIHAGPVESPVDDAKASFTQSYTRIALAQIHNDSTSVCKSESTYGTVCGSTTRLDPSQLVCDAVTHNGTDHDALDANDVDEISESRSDGVEDLLVGASLSADHEQCSPGFGFVFDTSCAGLLLASVYGLLCLYCCMAIAHSLLCLHCCMVNVHSLLCLYCCMVTANSLLQWYCCPKKLEKRPIYLRRRCELEALDAKLKLSCVSTRLRHCVALAKIRKRFRAWRIDTKNEKYDRIGHVVGVAFLLIVMFQPVAEGSVALSLTSSSTNMTHHHNDADLVNVSNVHTDMNQLAAINDLDLKEFIGSLVTGFQSELRELKMENAEIRKENTEMKGEIAVVQKENVQMRSENADIKEENAKIRKENAEIKTRIDIVETANVEVKREVAEMKMKNADIRRENAKMKGEVTELKTLLHETSNNTRTETEMLNAQVLQHSEQLDQCKEEASSFARDMERRRLQTTEHCQGVAMQAMLAACCPVEGGGGHRRELQSDHGCAAFPDTCSALCATVFTEFYESCRESIIANIPTVEQARFDDFYSACTEAAQQAAAALEGASPAMIFHVVVIDQEAEQQAAMVNGGSSPGTLHFGPVDLPHAPAPTPTSGAVAAQEFRVVCTLANLTVCTPQCNSFTYGYLLSMEIDGRGTVMTCNVMDSSYSWQGQASLGGFIGSDARAFLSAILSGASGAFFMHTESMDLGIDTDVLIRPRQHVIVEGHGSQWGRGTITIQDEASLKLIGIELFVTLTIEPGTSALSMRDCEVILPTPLIVPAGSNVTMRVDRTRIGVVRTVETFSSFQLGIAVDGELVMHALDLFWGSNVYVGMWVADAGRLSCEPCGMDMTPLGMYSLYQGYTNQNPRFLSPDSSQWQDLTTMLHTLEGHSGDVSSVAFDPSGGTLASGSSDQTVKLWDVASGECLRTLEGHSDGVWSVAFDPSGGILASGSLTVKLWDVASGECLITLEGHSDGVWSVAFDPSGGTLASGSSDQTVKLWDVASGECLRTLEGHSGDDVSSVA
eukprot:SAG31_NODE_3539_length_4144_cov_3.302101_1_plen_1330_part_01